MRDRKVIFIMAAVAVLLMVGASALYLVGRNSIRMDEAGARLERRAAPPAPVSPSPGAPSEGLRKSNLNPDLTVDDQGLSRAVAVVTTTKGEIRFRFYPEDAPATVARIIQLINEGFYDGIVFHRVFERFSIQAGDPTGMGNGGSGQKIRAEFNRRQHVDGAVAMARASDRDSADSQFFITVGPQPQLNGQFTVFGQVVEGMSAVRAIRIGDRIISAVIE